MNITTKQVGKLTLVQMPQRLVYGNAESVKNVLMGLFDSGHKQLTLDLHAVDFIDSSGLGVLVAAFKRAEKCGGQAVLLSPSDNARMLIELTRLHQVFDIYEDQNGVISALNAA